MLGRGILACPLYNLFSVFLEAIRADSAENCSVGSHGFYFFLL